MRPERALMADTRPARVQASVTCEKAIISSMESVHIPPGFEAVSSGAMAWRPWQLKQFEFFAAKTVSTPSVRHFSRGYFLLVAIQSGTSENHYRNTRSIDRGGEGMFRVFEPEEAWRCQARRASFQGLTVDPAWLHEMAGELLHSERRLPHFPSRCLRAPSLSAALHELARSSWSPASRLQQQELLLGLFAPLMLVHGEDGGALPKVGCERLAVTRAKEYLESHYAEEVPLQALASVAHLSAYHLARVFRQSVGVPPHAYQTQLRLARARKLLAQGLDCGDVANETGFFDQSHFTKQFRRYFFVNPGSYRRTAKYS